MAGNIPIEEPTRKIAAITRQPGAEPFQAAASEGRFLIPQCGACNRFHWYPRALCPFCFSDNIAWQSASGRGTVYSYTVMRRAKPTYAIAYVQLEEGPTMMTNIVGCDLDAIRIGMAVGLVFQPAENGPLVPMFKPM
jgi:uncharacterized OB-fold protein